MPLSLVVASVEHVDPHLENEDIDGVGIPFGADASSHSDKFEDDDSEESRRVDEEVSEGGADMSLATSISLIA
jgi:hypothetical protein